MSTSARAVRTAGRSPEFALLGFLYGGPAHGYELHQRLTRELGHVWSVSQAETYNILRRLEAQGFIRSRTRPQPKLPARNILRLTKAGRTRFETWLQAPGGNSVRSVRLEFITRLYFARQTGLLGAREMLDVQSDQVRDGLRQLEAQLAALPAGETYNRLGLEYQVAQRHSMLAWLADCRQTLNLQFEADETTIPLYAEDQMKLSARNILKGKVIKLTRGAVNCEVTIELAGGQQIVSIITNTSAESLKLREGAEAYAIIKASNVMVGTDEA